MTESPINERAELRTFSLRVSAQRLGQFICASWSLRSELQKNLSFRGKSFTSTGIASNASLSMSKKLAPSCGRNIRKIEERERKTQRPYWEPGNGGRCKEWNRTQHAAIRTYSATRWGDAALHKSFVLLFSRRACWLKRFCLPWAQKFINNYVILFIKGFKQFNYVLSTSRYI